MAYKIDVDHMLRQVLLVVSDGDQAGGKIIVNLEGEILAEHARPAPGIGYVSNGRPRGTRPKNPGASPKS